MSEHASDPEMLELARKLVTELENGNQTEADNCIAQLSDIKESSLFQELGKLTRDFHEALNSFRFDEKITSLAKEEIPDAKERLSFVITKTDEAAHRTLNALEAVMPLCDSINQNVQSLNDSWGRFTRRELGPAEFRELSKKLQLFFKETDTNVGDVRSNLNEVLMAQDFQDITGQIIKRVITLVTDVEKSLVELIKLGGNAVNYESSDKKKAGSHDLDGPVVPGIETEGTVSGQDEVDELLSSFGF